MPRRSSDGFGHHASVKSRSLALSATLALVLLPSQLPAAALPLLRTEWNASSAALGWVVSAYMLGYAAARNAASQARTMKSSQECPT